MKAVQRARESFWFVFSLHQIVAVVCFVAATATAWAADPITFAVFGDYGDNSGAELAVANMVKSWNPDFILAAGDNNYPSGSAATIDVNIGKYYQEFIGNYTGAYGPGAGNGPAIIVSSPSWATTTGAPGLDPTRTTSRFRATGMSTPRATSGTTISKSATPTSSCTTPNNPTSRTA